MDKFDILVEEVTELTGVVESAIRLIDGLAAQIEDCKDDPEQIAAIVANLQTQRDALAAAVAANTEPVVPDPEPEEPVA